MIDSCLDPGSGEPASLHYLRSLGIDPADSVHLVVVTHWDDDHIKGISRVIHECEAATVALSAALTKQDFIQLVLAEEQNAVGAGTGLDELRTILQLPAERRVWAKCNLPLYPRPPGDGPSVVALSPSEEAVERGIIALAGIAFDRPGAVGGRFRAPERPNGASVASFVRSGENRLLLAGDLEASNNPNSGWEAVIAHAKPEKPGSLVKVPHHGSDDAHHDGMWAELLEDDALAIVTPFNWGSARRPSDDDIARLCGLAGRVYATALPHLRRARLDRDVERVIRRTRGDAELLELHGWGHVRARREIAGGAWQVQVAGDAQELG